MAASYFPTRERAAYGPLLIQGQAFTWPITVCSLVQGSTPNLPMQLTCQPPATRSQTNDVFQWNFEPRIPMIARSTSTMQTCRCLLSPPGYGQTKDTKACLMTTGVNTTTKRLGRRTPVWLATGLLYEDEGGQQKIGMSNSVVMAQVISSVSMKMRILSSLCCMTRSLGSSACWSTRMAQEPSLLDLVHPIHQ